MKDVVLIVLDIDGTLTDGVIQYDSAGAEHRHFHVNDGLGISMGIAAGLQFAVLSGRRSEVVQRRMAELKVDRVIEGVGDKAAALRSLMEELGLRPSQVAFVGDDLNDLPAFDAAGVRIAVADACPQIRQRADFVTPRRGGHGAVRDAIEAVLTSQGRLDDAIDAYLGKIRTTTLPRQ